MKKTINLLLALMLTLSLCACANGNETAEENGAASQENTAVQSESSDTADETPATDSKVLVAYFSATGNTKGIAQKLSQGLNADIYEIVPETPYTTEDLDYSNDKSRSSIETNDRNSRPAISGSVENMDQYDTVLIGYPIWWGEAPRIMSTFIESYDFSGKKLAAFCTSSSSGFGSSDSALKEAAPDAAWSEGCRFSNDASEEEILKWAEGIVAE